MLKKVFPLDVKVAYDASQKHKKLQLIYFFPGDNGTHLNFRTVKYTRKQESPRVLQQLIKNPFIVFRPAG